MTNKKQQIIEGLRDKEYRDMYVAEHISTGIAIQIHATRESRGWTQAELGELAGMAQERISQLEDLDYGKFTLKTLRRLASAFDVALIVRFAPFSELASYMASLSSENLAIPSFSNDHLVDVEQ